MAPPRLRTACLLLGLAIAAFGCGSVEPRSVDGVLEPSSPPSSAPADPSEDETGAAAAFRGRFGLRSDDEWVRAVAGDPTARSAIHEFGIPLTPAEVADLVSRRWDPDLLANVKSYGSAFPESYAGAYVNLEASGVIVSITDDVERHRRALRNLLPGSEIDVRRAEWSLQDLDRFAREVEAEREWFDAIGETFDVGHRVTENWVNVRFKGRPEAEHLIERHFGTPTWLDAEWDGPPPGGTATVVSLPR